MEVIKALKANLVKGIGKESKKEYIAVELVLAEGVTKLVFLSQAETALLRMQK